MKHVYNVLLCAVVTTACGALPENVAVRSNQDWSTLSDGTETRTTGSLTVGSHRVAVAVVSDEAKGPGYVRTETFNHRGQKVVVEYLDGERASIRVKVGSTPEIEISANAAGRFEFARNSYNDNRHERSQLAVEIAESLLDRQMEKDSLAAQDVVGRALITPGHPLSRAHHLSGKLFFIPVFVDVTAEVKNNMGVAIGNDINQDFDNW